MKPKIESTTVKSWVALIALIVAGITSSDIVPVSGTAHKIWAVAVIIVGAIATWAIPNQVKTINGVTVSSSTYTKGVNDGS